MKRRFASLGLSLSPLFFACSALSRADELPRVGWLKIQGRTHTPEQLTAFRTGMNKLGHVEGRTYQIEARYGDDDERRLPELTRELIESGVEVIVATSQPSIAAAAKVTQSVPIVGRMVDDPVESQLATSLARPGHNITGIYSETEEMIPKRLEILHEIVPKSKKVGVLFRAGWPSADRSWKAARSAAEAMNVELLPFDVRNLEFLKPSFRAMTEQGIEGLITFRNPTIVDYYKEIVALANQHRFPAIYDASEFVLAGGLASYGPNIDAIYVRLASFVDKLLNGARVDELPIEQPTTFELVLNRRVASTLGITLPPLVTARADRIID